MKGLSKILVPTDLSEYSRRALLYGCWLAGDDKASLLVLHVANELNAWEYQTDELALVELSGKTWPVDRVLSEANLDLVRLLRAEPGEPKESRLRRQARRSRAHCRANRRRSRGRKRRLGNHVAATSSRLAPFALRRDHGSGHPIEPLSGAVDRSASAFQAVAREMGAAAIRLAET